MKTGGLAFSNAVESYHGIPLDRDYIYDSCKIYSISSTWKSAGVFTCIALLMVMITAASLQLMVSEIRDYLDEIVIPYPSRHQ